MVCPTIWGKMTLARLHVRRTFFSPFWFMASILFNSLGSMNGPFFSDLDITTSTTGSSYCGGAQYTGQISCCGGSCNPGSASPTGFSDRADRSAGGLHHHHEDGREATSPNRG